VTSQSVALVGGPVSSFTYSCIQKLCRDEYVRDRGIVLLLLLLLRVQMVHMWKPSSRLAYDLEMRRPDYGHNGINPESADNTTAACFLL